MARRGEFPYGGIFEVLRLPFASKKIPRPGPLWSFYEILGESLMGFLKLRDLDPDVVVIQNHRLFGLVYLLLLNQKRKYRLVWDLRELPTAFMNKRSLRAHFFGRLLQKCDAVIVTSQARQAHMEQLFGPEALERSVAIPNYPRLEFASVNKKELNVRLASILGNKSFFYIQNPSSCSRYPRETIEAILKYTNMMVVVSGRLNEQAKKELQVSWSDMFLERVVLTGMISADEIISLLDRCVASLVFYNWDRPNNQFCDPNRLYQAISRGTPVVVGANEGMRPIVENLCCGVVTVGDRRSIDHIGSSLQSLSLQYKTYRENAMKARNAFSWKSTEPKLLSAIFGNKW